MWEKERRTHENFFSLFFWSGRRKLNYTCYKCCQVGCLIAQNFKLLDVWHAKIDLLLRNVFFRRALFMIWH